MQLEYRYWSGIGTLEYCHSALDWYGMCRGARSFGSASLVFESRLILFCPNLANVLARLADVRYLTRQFACPILPVGSMGTGASVASTGHNTQ